MSTQIRLSFSEIAWAAIAGVMRQVQNLKSGRAPAHGAGNRADWQLHIEGALGEIALAKALNEYPSGMFSFRARDLGDYQVRTTTHESGRLIVHKDDPDDDTFVLMIGLNGAYRIAGFISGAGAKQRQWWTDPGTGRPAYFVPQTALTPFEDGRP